MEQQQWYLDVVRAFFGMLDRFIYGLISTAYDLVAEIAHYKVFESVDDFTQRIYAMLGIFMLFKVSFSFINYVINPDSFTDKEKGVQHIIKNIVIMFIMLIACPWAFKTAWTLQADILDENVIGRLVFADVGDNSLKTTSFMYNRNCDNSSTAKTNGDYIAIMTLRGFYQLHDISELREIDASYDEADYNKALKKLCKAKSTDNLLVSSLYNAESAKLFKTDYYFVNYKWGISTAVGVVVLLILVNFAMDVGLRVVKLSFLELLAPIPIVSYIDPASGKNGMFKKWLKEVGTTWASIFIRLLALFFAVSVIQKVGELQFIGRGDANPKFEFWVQLFVIIGALMFAKQLPKLIQNITGLNLDGGFSLNPMKKLKDNALGVKAIANGAGGVAAGGIGFAGGAASNAWAAHKNNAKARSQLEKDGITKDNPDYNQKFRAAGGRNALGYAGTVLAGGASSAARAVVKGKDGKFHPIKNATAGISESSAARNLRAKNYGFDDKVKDFVSDVAGIKFSSGTTSQLKEEVNRLEQELANSRRNEQAMSNAFNQRISEMGNLTSDLLKVFDGEAESYDSRGNITKYKAKTYEQYAVPALENAARLEAIEHGEAWNDLSDVRKEIYRREVQRNGGIVDRTTFEALNSLYNTRNEEDLKGKKLERDINDLKSDMEKFNKRKKG